MREKFKSSTYSLSLIFLIFLLQFFSCGTLRSPNNIAPIDSEPRGISVLNEQGQTIGITPFFYKFPKGRKHKLSIGGQTVNYTCSWNWSGSLLPDNIWMIGLSAGSIGISIGLDLIDLISGGIYNCHDLLKVSQKSDRITPRKKRILILPPMHRDELFSEKMVRAIMKKFSVKDGNYISYLKAKSYLHLNGINNFRPNDPRIVNETTLRKISYKLNLTHIMYVEVKKGQGDFLLVPRIFDIFDLKRNKKLKTVKFGVDHKVKNSLIDYLLDTISLLPNAATVGYMSNPTVEIDGTHHLKGGGSQNTSRHPNSFPKFLSSFGLETVHHSMFFDSWDIDFFLSPSFSTSAWRSSYSDYSINVQAYNAMFGGFVVGQSPFGQLSWGLSLGLLYLNAQDSLGHKTYKGTLGTKVSVDYKYFFGERIYLTFGANLYEPGERTLRYQEYHLKSWTKTFIGLGYYFPEVKSILRSIF